MSIQHFLYFMTINNDCSRDRRLDVWLPFKEFDKVSFLVPAKIVSESSQGPFLGSSELSLGQLGGLDPVCWSCLFKEMRKVKTHFEGCEGVGARMRYNSSVERGWPGPGPQIMHTMPMLSDDQLHEGPHPSLLIVQLLYPTCSR